MAPSSFSEKRNTTSRSVLDFSLSALLPEYALYLSSFHSSCPVSHVVVSALFILLSDHLFLPTDGRTSLLNVVVYLQKIL